MQSITINLYGFKIKLLNKNENVHIRYLIEILPNFHNTNFEMY